MKGKNINDLLKEGLEKMSGMSFGGVASGAAPAEAKAEAK